MMHFVPLPKHSMHSISFRISVHILLSTNRTQASCDLYASVAIRRRPFYYHHFRRRARYLCWWKRNCLGPRHCFIMFFSYADFLSPLLSFFSYGCVCTFTLPSTLYFLVVLNFCFCRPGTASTHR